MQPIQLLKSNMTVLLLLIVLTAKAQDPQFSQFYAAPLYLNPAMVGNTYDARATFNYRNQWVGLPANFETFMVGYDQFIPSKNISLGGTIRQDRSTLNQRQSFTNTNFDIIGGYLLSISKEVKINFGLQVGVMQSSLAFNSLLFSDQIGQGGVVGGSTQEQLLNTNAFAPDVSAGALVFGRNFFGGVSFHHINSPNVNFLGGQQSYPMKFSLMGGYVIPLEYANRRKTVYSYKGKSITPVALFMQQGKYSQLSLGAYANLYPMIFGFWYRGLPVIKQNEQGSVNHDAIILMVGTRIKKLKFGYSMDWTLTKLPQQAAMSHEISLGYDLNLYKNYRKKKKRKAELLPCSTPWIN
ncbi:PorP/SprF family type IX secretion system membrane protein [Flammeovirga sp. MY04]|uniref:PorP/SprF family type IX secretion system membrane protein n=1 Tax=Flammeovirga sp. MY04 TaxID=1191459 RepID=UPI0013050975|nr:PorP/SprF family type IX secretion system membrane protein [Flammeovirga sp. MY04]ANQ51997.2 PorP/SprF family type IX secretion system membrane protein [Flammeovirga sp. MY04]